MPMIQRRDFLSGLGWAMALAATPARAAETIQVLKTASCGCCTAWMAHLRKSGFQVTAKDVALAALNQEKLAAGLTPELASCHTARVAGYVIEGHVPAREIARLLRERPAAIGLAVPGMPAGSPGMEASEDEPYDVLLVRKGGLTEVFARYS